MSDPEWGSPLGCNSVGVYPGAGYQAEFKDILPLLPWHPFLSPVFFRTKDYEVEVVETELKNPSSNGEEMASNWEVRHGSSWCIDRWLDLKEKWYKTMSRQMEDPTRGKK